MSQEEVIVRAAPEHRLAWASVAALGSEDTLGPLVAAGLSHAGVGLAESTVWPETLQSAGFLKLEVPLFSAQQLGAAVLHGPMRIDTIVEFCRWLHAHLAQNPGLVCLACSGRPGARQNSLLLFGAFLILECGIGADEVMKLLLPAGGTTIGTLAPRDFRFPLPWQGKVVFSDCSLTIKDCLQGLQVARENQWFDFKAFDTERYLQTATAYDAIPIFSVEKQTCSPFGTTEPPQLGGAESRSMRFWVMADPVTTVQDPDLRPDPETEEDRASVMQNKCRHLKTGVSRGTSSPGMVSCDSSVSKSLTFVSHSLTDMSSSVVNCVPQEQWDERRCRQERGAIRRTLSRASNAATPKKVLSGQKHMARPENLPAFARWLKKDLSCCLIVRCNPDGERGLPPSGTYGDFLQRWGVPTMAMPWEDGLEPPQKVVASLVQTVAEMLDDMDDLEPGVVPSVVVHCRGGFGRSMALLGGLAVALNPGLRAAAYFGWARMVRPGSVQTPCQEAFLRSLDSEGVGCCF